MGCFIFQGKSLPYILLLSFWASTLSQITDPCSHTPHRCYWSQICTTKQPSLPVHTSIVWYTYVFPLCSHRFASCVITEPMGCLLCTASQVFANMVKTLNLITLFVHCENSTLFNICCMIPSFHWIQTCKSLKHVMCMVQEALDMSGGSTVHQQQLLAM